MSAEDAFMEALAAERQREGGSNFQLAREAVGGSNRELANALGVDIRTVQRWSNYDAGTGKQARNPEASPKASDMRALADVQREQRALDRIAASTQFNAEVDVEYETTGDDEGSRQAYAVQPINMRPVVEAYRNPHTPMADVGAALTAAIEAAYPMPLGITDVSNLSLR